MLRFIAVHENVLVVVETMLLNVLNPMVMYSMIDVDGHSVDEEGCDGGTEVHFLLDVQPRSCPCR